MGSRITGHRWNNFAKALLLSLALHALVLSLQFGDSDSGLPRFGMPEESKTASIPMLNAILHNQEVVEKSLPELATQAVVGSSEQHTPGSLNREPPPSNLPPEPVTASIAKLETRPPESVEKRPVAGVTSEAPKIVAPAADVAVLSTDKTSTWSRPVGGDETLNKQEGAEHKKETPAPEQKTVEEQVRIEGEKAAQAAAAQEKELALERKRAEEQAAEARAREEAARAQQAAAEALARQHEVEKLAAEKAAKETAEKKLAEQQKMAEEQARIEKEKAAQVAAAREKELALERKQAEEQAAAARAREEAALAQQAAAKALAHQREAEKLATEKAAKDAAGKILAEQQDRLSNMGTGKPDGGKESGSAPTAGKGSDLARRAIDAIRGGQMGLPGIESAEPVRPRHGSILGRNPKEIQLAFYGEGWRQKIERIGSLNYPTLSKNLVYDPLVATVSINSDGTLAGVRVVKSSGHKDLDEAVLRIVTMSAPFAPFPPDMKRMYDVVDLTRTWVFLDYRPTITGE
ncbi:conserved exported protein of unknown function [Georgfuchsia toluolica]|uniref:TonB family protein n=1 Tax=Georgfuchsia toluolica TaxID=424218 RepID=A0A916N0S0_9PROT|nr:cell envelope integrity protein TolA [Georgfuchsia toluolica]CAG4884213.1 conserved exported protein of unknown function [Georgfuchsia toluolica]